MIVNDKSLVASFTLLFIIFIPTNTLAPISSYSSGPIATKLSEKMHVSWESIASILFQGLGLESHPGHENVKLQNVYISWPRADGELKFGVQKVGHLGTTFQS